MKNKKIFIGSDHRGFALKEELKKYLSGLGADVSDAGALYYDPDDDYPDFAQSVAQEVSRDPDNNLGVVLCGSGAGVDMVANKVKGVRSALVFNEAVARQAREHENANVIAIPSDWITDETAKRIIDAWMGGAFMGEERHLRRLGKMSALEQK